MSSGTLPLSGSDALGVAMPAPPSGATVKFDVRSGNLAPGPGAGAQHVALCDFLRECWEQGSNAAAAEALTSGDYVVTVKRVEDLRAQEEDEEDRPSEYAYRTALELLRQAARELGRHFRRAGVSVGPERSLRITWSLGVREVRLICGGRPTNKTYIYQESPGGHAVEYRVNGAMLAGYLRWLLQEG